MSTCDALARLKISFSLDADDDDAAVVRSAFMHSKDNMPPHWPQVPYGRVERVRVRHYIYLPCHRTHTPKRLMNNLLSGIACVHARLRAVGKKSTAALHINHNPFDEGEL